MTQLEAVNLILTATEEQPVDTLDQDGIYPLNNAKDVLLEASRNFQSSGWSFNTEEDFPLTRQVDGTITLPSNVLKSDVNDEFTDVSPVARGVRLYDRKKHTYVFERDLKAKVTFFLPWDELPQTARYVIAVMAARIAQGRMSVSDRTYRYTEGDLERAMLAFSESENQEGDYNVLRDSFSVANILRDRYDL